MSAVVFIPLTQDKVAVIDFEDFEKVRLYRWSAFRGRKTWYARRSVGTNSRKVYLHRALLDASKTSQVDHKDGNGLNNQRDNLRLCSNSQNHQAFQSKHLAATSKYRGVCWHFTQGRWFAQIKHKGKHFNLGSFANEEAAARAYDKKARELFGEFAAPNFPV